MDLGSGNGSGERCSDSKSGLKVELTEPTDGLSRGREEAEAQLLWAQAVG